MTALRADRAEIDAAISKLFTPGQVVEVRILRTRVGTISGYFNDHEALAGAIVKADAQHKPTGIYWTVNPVNPELLARADNRLRERAEYTTADTDVTGRRWLPIDLDPVRPKGISANDEEHLAAAERARIIAADMPSQWGQPIIADSGNGSHLLYRADLPNDKESLAYVSALLKDLHRRYSDDRVKVDIGVGNAARILKVYGTVSRKGDARPDRPHRLSSILEVPSDRN